MAMTDTSGTARRHYVAGFAVLSGAERVERAVEMAEEAKAIAVAGIRSREPHLTDDEVAFEWLRLLYGDDLAARLR